MSLLRQRNLKSLYLSLEEFEKSINPDRQEEICRNPELCITADYNTLEDLDAVYGFGSASSWLINQLFDLGEYCGAREKMTERQYSHLASVIATQYQFLKISEFMLFCWWFKGCRYGDFYNVIDPMRIMGALRRFIADRNQHLFSLSQRQREEEDKENNKGTINYQEWCKLKGRDPSKPPSVIFGTPKEKDYTYAYALAQTAIESKRDDMREVFKKHYGVSPEEFIQDYDTGKLHTTKGRVDT